MNEFIVGCGQEILLAILTALAGCAGLCIKKLYEKHCADATVKNVVKTCVTAAEQLYKDLKGEEKFKRVKADIIAILAEKGITTGETELQMMIESIVSAFNNQLGGI